MSRTLIQEMRAIGDLMMFFDLQGGNPLDQSGNGHVLTVPSDAHFGRSGLRCFSAPSTIDLDMSATENIGIFFQVAGRQADAVNNQFILELTTEGSVTAGGWQAYEVAAGDSVRYRFAGSSGTTGTSVSISTRTDSYFCSARLDRRLSYEAVTPYERGILTTGAATDANTNDGSKFANDTIYVMGRSDNSDMHRGLLQVFGIVNFGTTQWTAAEQSLLYSQIRNKETM